MSLATISIPSAYGYVVLTSVIGTGFITSTYMGTVVMSARTKYNVPYPNLYATPGYHKDADTFNRVQRGHQALFEQLPAFIAMCLIGGIKYPIATAVHAVFYNLGCIFFQIGYADCSLDVKDARYKRGGGIKWLGFFGAMYCCVASCGTIIGWW
jgi:glutathione S-transferase